MLDYYQIEEVFNSLDSWPINHYAHPQQNPFNGNNSLCAFGLSDAETPHK